MHDLRFRQYRVLDRDFALDRHCNRPMDCIQISTSCTLRPSYFNRMPQIPSFLI